MGRNHCIMKCEWQGPLSFSCFIFTSYFNNRILSEILYEPYIYNVITLYMSYICPLAVICSSHGMFLTASDGFGLGEVHQGDIRKVHDTLA